MKQEQSRILAFSLATEITQEELAEVSGGAQSIRTHAVTSHGTNYGLEF